jgi:hypothetical protein
VVFIPGMLSVGGSAERYHQMVCRLPYRATGWLSLAIRQLLIE